MGVKIKKKKKKVKHRIKLIPVLILLLIMSIISIVIFLLQNIKIQNIYIHGNVNLSDEYIINYLDIQDYPSYFSKVSLVLENKLESNPYIKDATVKYKFFAVLDITINEEKVLFYKNYDNKYVLGSLKEVDSIPYEYVNTPKVINYIPDTVYDMFTNRYQRLNINVIDKISEIKYDPTDYDEERFLFYMVDGNYVYVTTTKLESINYYNDIYPTLEGKKGTIYLDSGNHFQPF